MNPEAEESRTEIPTKAELQCTHLHCKDWKNWSYLFFTPNFWVSNNQSVVGCKKLIYDLDWCFLIFIFTLFYFTILYWFCHTLTWIHYGYTWVPKHELPSHLQPHIISLDHPHTPTPSILYPASNIDWRFDSYMIVYMCQKKNDLKEMRTISETSRTIWNAPIFKL